MSLGANVSARTTGATSPIALPVERLPRAIRELRIRGRAPAIAALWAELVVYMRERGVKLLYYADLTVYDATTVIREGRGTMPSSRGTPVEWTPAAVTAVCRSA